MVKAKKLKSGSWRCLVFAGYDDQGKRKYKSITVKDPSRKGKKECERLAAEWSAQNQELPSSQLTVHATVRKYIDIKKKVLSPSTIRAYELYLRRRIQPIKDKKIGDLTQTDVQQWINGLTGECAPKYIKNVYGLFSAALSYYGHRSFDVAFPSAAPKATYTPCDADIMLLLDHIADRPQLLSAVLLAAFGSLRRGEICALQPADLTENRVRICKSMVRDTDGYWHTRPMAKTDDSNRLVILPPQVAAMIQLPICLHPEQVSNRFRRAVASSGCQRRFRFHDLRHYYVSIAHALGIPDAYIMSMGGWRTDYVMHRVYRDTLPDVMASEQAKLTDHFNTLFIKDISCCNTCCMDPTNTLPDPDYPSSDQTQKTQKTRTGTGHFSSSRTRTGCKDRAGGGTRTHTPSRTADFESASSAIPTRRQKSLIRFNND